MRMNQAPRDGYTQPRMPIREFTANHPVTPKTGRLVLAKGCVPLSLPAATGSQLTQREDVILTLTVNLA